MLIRTRLVTAVALSAALVVAAPGGASADVSNGGGDDGFAISVNVVVTGGKGDPVPSGGLSISVPPQCWWEPSPGVFAGWQTVDLEDPEAFDDWYRDVYLGNNGTFAPARLFLPSKAEFRDAIRRHQAGEDVSWYHLRSAEGVNCADEGFTRATGSLPPGWYQPGDSNTAGLGYIAVAGSPPEPLVDVEDVVESLWDHAAQQLAAPEVARSPSVDGADDATLVNVPNWFWVQNVEEALAGDGEIHLEVSIPGTPVRASLDAETTGMDVSSPVGSVSCTVDQARQPFEVGVSEDAGCVTPLTDPNPAGWPVTASITWTGTWEGADHNGAHGGDLASQSHSSTLLVPVVEVGSTVTEVD